MKKKKKKKKTGARYYTIKCLVVVINNHGNLKCLNVEGSERAASSASIRAPSVSSWKMMDRPFI
jgi:hypothetical protein